MSILIISNNKDPKPWADALKKELPDTEINIFPEVTDEDEVEFAICWKPDNNVLKNFPNIKAIQSLGASVEHIFDTNEIERNVQISRIIDPQLSHDMYEFLLAITMNHLRKLKLYNNQQDKKKWEQHSYRNIQTSTVSILGAGKIGGYVAANFAKVGFNVQTWSEEVVNIHSVNSFYEDDGLENMLGNTDILINLLPLTKETKGILNKTNLLKLKQGAYLINVGRGPHLLNEDLVELLSKKHLSGAFLDVFNEEPLPKDDFLWEHPGISITPHIASLTNINTAVNQIVENYKRLKDGKYLLNLVSHKKGY
ncbi:2-hydroxyacid dehydrogenase [Bacteroidota bacterium]